MVLSRFLSLVDVDVGRVVVAVVVVGVGDEVGEDLSVLGGEGSGQSQDGRRKQDKRVGYRRRW